MEHKTCGKVAKLGTIFFIFLLAIHIAHSDKVYRANGDISNSFTTQPFPTVVKQTGLEKDFSYKFKDIGGGEFEVIVCAKQWGKTKDKLQKSGNDLDKYPISKNGAKQKDLKLKTNKCQVFTTTLNKFDTLKLGEESTEIILTEHDVTFTISPEYKMCSYLNCESEIIIYNENNHSITLNITSLTSTIGTIGTYIQMPYNVTACLDEYCNSTEQQTVFRTIYSTVGTVDIAAGAHHTFYNRVVLPNSNTQYKYDVTINYLGQAYTIDPYFTTTGSGFNDNSAYNRTYLNASGFVQLNLTFNNGTYTQQYDYGVNATVAFHNISWNSSVYGSALPSNVGSDTQYADGFNMANNVLLMRMDDSANPVTDYSGNGNTGTYDGVLWQQTGIINYSIKLDGINDEIIVSNAPTIQFGNLTDFTYSVWVKRVSLGVTDIIVDKRSAVSSGWGVWFLPSNQINVRLGLTQLNSGAGVVADTDWHHIAVVADRNESVSIYIDAVQYETLTDTTARNVSTSSDLYMGVVSYAAVLFYDGYFDETAIFDKVLTAADVKNIYKRGITDLTLKVRSCAASCSNEAWQQLGSISPQDVSIADNRYFQYQFSYNTLDQSYTPELWAVDVFYDGVCTPNWVAQYDTPCLINDSHFKYYTDINSCNTVVGLPSDNGTTVACNYCSQDIKQVYGTCAYNGSTFVTTNYYEDLNYNTCCNVTNITSDCGINYTPYNQTTVTPCTVPTEDNAYLTIALIILGVIAVLLYFANHLEFFYFEDSHGNQIPIMKYLVILGGGWMLLVVANIAVRVAEMTDVALVSSVTAFYKAVLYILVFVSTLWFLGLMFYIFKRLGWVGDKEDEQ